MKRHTILFSVYILLGLVVSACSTIEVSNNYDPEYPFSKLKSYSWIDNPDIKVKDPLVEKQFRKIMETQLKSKGFYLSKTKPDFKIAYHSLTVKSKIEVTNWGYGYSRGYRQGYGSGYGQWGSGFDTYQYDEGSVVIDFIDAKTNSLFYRSKVTLEVDPSANYERRQKNMQEAVKKILGKFPPAKDAY